MYLKNKHVKHWYGLLGIKVSLMIIFEDVVNSELTQLEIKVQATSIGCLFSLL